MPSTPTLTIDDSFVHDLLCAICGQDALRVVHVKGLPDYVTCDACASAFVVEDGGERVMYGKIDEAYPETQRIALRKWISFESIGKMAAFEHPPTKPVDTPEVPSSLELEPSEPTPPIEEGPPSAPPFSIQPETPLPPRFQDLEPEVETLVDESPPIDTFESLDIDAEVELPVTDITSEVDELSAQVSAPIEAEAVVEAPPLMLSENDPPPGQRFRVTIQGSKVKFPDEVCAHCMGTPVRRQLAIVGSLPKDKDVSQRQVARFKVPLCAECHKRAVKRSEEEKGARLQAHLISALIALVLLVLALALGLNPVEEGPTGIVILLALAAAGYTVPALILLSRLGPHPMSADAAYVWSTLLVPREAQGLETAFEWRNEAYADRFYEANQEASLGMVVQVMDQSQSNETQP